jgi:hypothetical protein
MEDSVPLAKYLLSRGADIHVEDSKGQTPLYFAARSSNSEMVSAFSEAEKVFQSLAKKPSEDEPKIVLPNHDVSFFVSPLPPVVPVESDIKSSPEDILQQEPAKQKYQQKVPNHAVRLFDVHQPPAPVKQVERHPKKRRACIVS